MKKYTITTFLILLFCLFITKQNINAEETIKTYDGELGYSYSVSSTEFKIWSSSASEIELIVEGLEQPKKMTKDENTNVWVGFVSGDLSGKEYSYNIKYGDGTVYENILDPYGKYLNKDGTKNMVFAENVVSFDDWYNMKNNLNIKDKNKIIYGINIANFSLSSSWSGSELNRGKLLSLNESETKYNNVATGFDHVKNLGITYIELSDLIDEKVQFAVNRDYVSGEFGYSGKLEFRQVINSYYSSNIGVIVSFDLVELKNKALSILNKIDKGYFSSDDWTCEKIMWEKYIEDLIVYWAKDYKLSGVKFENMAFVDVDFINKISNELLLVNPNIFIYGNGNYEVLDENKAGENNLGKLANVKMANGSLNYALLGNLNSNNELGILEGNYSNEIIESLKFALLSSVDNGEIDYSLVKGISYKNYWGNEMAYQLVNYLGSKKGLSLYDKLKINNLSGNKKLIEQKAVLAFATLMISGGVPYIESGNEFLVSYQNFNDNNDSVCTSDSGFCFYNEYDKKVLDWSSIYENTETINAFRSLINFRKADTTITQVNSRAIKKYVDIYIGEDGTVGYIRKYPNAYVNDIEKVFVIFNYSNNDYQIKGFDEDGWSNSYQYNLSSMEKGNINMKAYSIYIAQRIMPPKVNQWILLILVIGVIGLLYSLNIYLNKKLVEKRGYDIKDINKKYRPFISRNKSKQTNDEKINEEDDQGENKQ